MESALKRSRQPDAKRQVQCNSIRLNAAGRSLPAPVERSILHFCELSELGELLVTNKAMRALVDGFLQVLQTLRAEFFKPTDTERRLLARAFSKARNLREFRMHDPGFYIGIEKPVLEAARCFVARILQANERSLEVVHICGWEDSRFRRRSPHSLNTMPQIFAAAARCPNLREFIAPFANVSLRAKQSLMLPAIERGQPHEIKFDELFRGACLLFAPS